MSDVLPGVRTRRSGLPRGRREHGSSSSGRRARCQWPGLEPPFCAARTAVRFDVTAVDLRRLGNPALIGQGCQYPPPNTATAPPVPAVIDRRRGTVIARTVLPATAALEHVDDARDHPPIVDPACPWLVTRQVRLDRCPRRIRQPEQRSSHSRASITQRLPESVRRHRIKQLIGFEP